MTEATERVATDIRTAARYWIEDSDLKLTVDFVAAAGSGKDVKWTMVPEATLKQAEFMVDVGTIKVKPKSWKDYFFPEAYGLPGGWYHSAATRAASRSAISFLVSGSRCRPYSMLSSSGSKPRIRKVVTPRS